MVKVANAQYAKHIDKFDQAIIKRISKDPSLAGAIPPEQVVDTIFKRGQHSNMEKVMRVVQPDTRAAIRNEAMTKLAGSFVRSTDDPTKQIFDGKGLLDALDGYGKETVEAAFGKETTEDLYRLARVTQFVTQKQKMSGGIVAAGIAVHPLQNLGRLVRINVMSKAMNTDAGMKWLTEGLKAPRS